MLYVGLKRRGAIRLQPGWMVFFAQLGAGLLVLAGVLYLANHEFDWMALAARPWRRTGVLALVVGLGALAYLGTLVATGLRLSQFMRKI
jgi:putative peptidoglycan lipid II flippase